MMISASDLALKSEEEHDERLNQVMKKLEEDGLTLNYDKCAQHGVPGKRVNRQRIVSI